MPDPKKVNAGYRVRLTSVPDEWSVKGYTVKKGGGIMDRHKRRRTLMAPVASICLCFLLVFCSTTQLRGDQSDDLSSLGNFLCNHPKQVDANIELLLAYLDSDDPGIRSRSFQLLKTVAGNIKTPPKSIVRALIRATESREFYRDQAADALARLSKRPIDEVVEAIGASGSQRSIRTFASVLGSWGSDSKDAVPTLARIVSQNSADNPELAFEVASNLLKIDASQDVGATALLNVVAIDNEKCSGEVVRLLVANGKYVKQIASIVEAGFHAASNDNFIDIHLWMLMLIEIDRVSEKSLTRIRAFYDQIPRGADFPHRLVSIALALRERPNDEFFLKQAQMFSSELERVFYADDDGYVQAAAIIAARLNDQRLTKALEHASLRQLSDRANRSVRSSLSQIRNCVPKGQK